MVFMQVLHSQSQDCTRQPGGAGGPSGSVSVTDLGSARLGLCEESLDPEDSAGYIAVQFARLAALCR